MIVFSDIEIYDEIEEYDTIFIGLPFWDDYESAMRNLETLLDNDVILISNSYFFLVIELLSEPYRKIEISNEEFIMYCGFNPDQVKIWTNLVNIPEKIQFFLKFLNCASILPMFFDFLKLFCTCDGNLKTFYNKASPLLKLYKKYMNRSKRYIIVNESLILSGTLEELKHLNFPSFPDDVFQDRYISFLEASEKIKTFNYFTGNCEDSEFFLTERESEYLKTLKMNTVIYLNEESTEFGYSTIVNEVTTISLSCKKCTIINQNSRFRNREDNRAGGGGGDGGNSRDTKNYCCYDTDLNEIFGITSTGYYFSYKCEIDTISKNQSYVYKDFSILFKLFKAKHVTFYYNKQTKEIIYQKNLVQKSYLQDSFDESELEYRELDEDEDYDENYV